MKRLEQLCVQYLEACLDTHNVLAALQNASKLRLDFLKVYNFNMKIIHVSDKFIG